MPKIKLLISLVLIVLVVTLVGGATMAWFTATADPIENVFEAGTVEIGANMQGTYNKIVAPNWNPGDCSPLNICVENNGTKAILIRGKFDARWTPGYQRMLIVYTSNTIQLLTVDWNSFCKGITVTDGPIARGFLTLQHDAQNSFGTFPINFNPKKPYFTGTFSDIVNILNSQGEQKNWLSNTSYNTWCVDSQTTTSLDKRPVQVFDPYWNKTWYTGLSVNNRWTAIDWHIIDYIVNNYPIGVDGYTSQDIQQAIWAFTNPVEKPIKLENRYKFLHGTGDNPSTIIIVSPKAKAIIDDAHKNAALTDDLVTFNPGSNWIKNGDWWYYNGVLTASGDAKKVCLNMNVCFSGAATNKYQGANFNLFTYFEAVQASNNASLDVFGVNSVYSPANNTSGINWLKWGAPINTN